MESDELSMLHHKKCIRQVLEDYCRGIDRLDFELVRTCYHPDASDDHGPFGGSIDELLEWLPTRLQRYRRTLHVLANCLIEISPDNASRARVESYGLVYREGTDVGDIESNTTQACRYIDRFEMRDGHWRIARRVCVTEWSEVVTSKDRVSIPDGAPVGKRQRPDALYEA